MKFNRPLFGDHTIVTALSKKIDKLIEKIFEQTKLLFQGKGSVPRTVSTIES
jgi:hypothetical protein